MIGVGRADVRPPSLQTGQAGLPHPAFQSVGALSRGSGSSPRPQECRPDFRCHPDQLRRADSAAGKPLRALASVLCPLFFPSFFHFPASLRSTVVTRFPATTDALTPASQMRGLLARRTPRHWRVSLIIAGVFPAIPSPTICGLSGVRPAASGSGPPRQASPASSRLAHPRRPNRVHGDGPHGSSVLRTGRSRSVAPHPALLRRSYGSIPHDSSPHRSGLPPLHTLAFSGALEARVPAAKCAGIFSAPGYFRQSATSLWHLAAGTAASTPAGWPRHKLFQSRFTAGARSAAV